MSTDDAAKTVKWPQAAVDAAGPDLRDPLARLLRSLGMLGEPEEKAVAEGVKSAFTGPPLSFAILEAGATALGKWWTAAIAALGGASAITTAATRFWKGTPSDERIAILAGSAFVVAAAIVAVAMMVQGDVRARAHAMAAQYEGRADIARAFLDGTTRLQLGAASEHPSALSDPQKLALLAWAPHRKVMARVVDGGSALVTGVRYQGSEFEVRVGTDYVSLEKIEHFESD